MNNANTNKTHSENWWLLFFLACHWWNIIDNLEGLSLPCQIKQWIIIFLSVKFFAAITWFGTSLKV